MFRLSFDQDKKTNLIKRFVLHSHVPTLFGAAGFGAAHFVHDMLPATFGKVGITVLQINLGNLQVYGGLLTGFVESVEKPFGLHEIGGIEAVALLGDPIKGIVNAVFAAEDAVSIFHGSFWLRASHSTVPTC